MNEVILSAQNLKMHFPKYSGILFRKKVSAVKAVDGISLTIKEGETLGLVGESGCGKSTLGRTLIRLNNPTSGKVELCRVDITNLRTSELNKHRSKIQMIFQDPYASLNPRMTVYDLIAEPILTHSNNLSKDEVEKKVADLMGLVGLSQRYILKYPHEFSGGQRQRIAIARALAVNPKIIICDEPVSALDVSIQAQILNLLKDLQKKLNLSLLFIAHDISAVRYISDRISVMYLGKIVETANSQELFDNPQHPYTKALLSAVPIPDPKLERQRKQILLKGDLPSPLSPPVGCPFHTRCPSKLAHCDKDFPEVTEVNEGHHASCYLLTKDNQ